MEKTMKNRRFRKVEELSPSEKECYEHLITSENDMDNWLAQFVLIERYPQNLKIVDKWNEEERITFKFNQNIDEFDCKNFLYEQGYRMERAWYQDGYEIVSGEGKLWTIHFVRAITD